MTDSLLAFHTHTERQLNSLSIESETEKFIRISGWTQDLLFEPTGEYNEYGGGELRLEPGEFAEALAATAKTGYWSRNDLHLRRAQVVNRTGGALFRLRKSLRRPEIRSFTGELSVRVGSGIYAPAATATLSRSRADLLLLDAYETTFTGPRQARTGMQQPAASLDSEFLNALRSNPQHLAELKTVGLERAILALLNRTAGGTVYLERLNSEGTLLLARSTTDGCGPMLLSVHESTSSQVTIDIVDRINGVRDRQSVTKAAIVTRSHFSTDAERSYEGLSQRMELIDFDRLRGILTDEGWLSHSEGFLTLPVAARPPHAVFISYSWKQRTFAKWLHRKLHGWRYDCYLDSVDISPGDVILSSIEKALNGVDVVILCCSAEALSSPWVQLEIDTCIAREKSTGKKILLPVRLDDAQFRNAQAELNGRLTLDLRGWRDRRVEDDDELARLVTAVDEIIQQGRP